MPAPPPESDEAIVRQRGTVTATPFAGITRIRFDGCDLSPGWAPRSLHVTIAPMADAYSHSTWVVKPGLEDEFVRRWTELADWSSLQGLTARATLLRDVDDRRRFVSFGPWESVD